MVRGDEYPIFVYGVDADDVVTSVSDAWLEFAVRNAAPELTRNNVVGRCLWDFITDRQTRHLYALLFERARQFGSVLGVPFRCDSPDCRRFMELDIVALADRGLTIESRLLREESRETVQLPRSSTSGIENLLEVCGWCKKIHTEEGTWIEIEEAAKECALFSGPVNDITHSICPACYERTRAKLGQSR